MSRSASVLSIAACLIAGSVQAEEAVARVTVSIEAQPVGQALSAFAQQTGLQLLFRSDGLEAATQAPRLAGTFTPQAALDRLLENTTLTYQFLDARTVTIKPAKSAVPDTKPQAELDGARNASGVWARVRLAQAEQTNASGDASAGDDSAPDTGKNTDGQSASVEEVVVTAQKRIERLQDVPVPVTALSTETLLENHQVRLQDYFSSVPGLNLTSQRGGDSQLSIRGVTTGGLTNPTVGIVLDDAPYGSISALGSSLSFALDVDPSDLERIEVLRGPQGTLYGASSMGGLLKYVTIDPSTESLTGRVQADVNGVRNGDGEGYSLRASANVPLSDTVAIRASGFTRHEPGYVDGLFAGEPATRIRGVNVDDVSGGRVSMLWRPNDNWSVKLSALMQNKDADGLPKVSPGAGDLQQVLTLREPDSYRHEVKSYSGTVRGSVRGLEVISITGYGIDQHDASVDLSHVYGGIGGPADQFFGVTGAKSLAHRETSKFTQEVRLSGAAGPRLDWLAGVFYTHEDTPTHDRYYAVDPATSEVAGLLFDDPYPTTYAEQAVFGDITVHFTDRFNVQIGGRASENKQSYSEIYSGPLLQGDPLAIPPVHTQDSSFTYLLTPSFKIAPDLMLYGRLASGYRPGGPNPLCTLFDANCSYEPDTTTNYEIGIKGQAFDHALSFEGSVYYIDWKDVQIALADPDTSQSYFANATRARSRGVELSMQARPLRRLTIAAWVAWNDATLSESLPVTSGAIGFDGDRLPNSARFSGHLSLDSDWPVTNRVTAFWGASLSYVGTRQGGFPSPAQAIRYEMPGYAQTNLRVGARYESWMVNLYVNNLADKRGQLAAYDPSEPYINYTQPRTAGIGFTKTFP